MKILISIFLVLSITGFSCAQKNESTDIKNLKYSGKITAPDFPNGAEWLNTENPVSLKDLRGKLVLLDFWTLGCINCQHIIPDLKKLESKYEKELQVIGVHSAKFLNERGTENIRQAILRNEITHPVINDREFEVWNAYTANAWPTIVLIDPAGKIIEMQSGEGVFEHFDPIISSAIDEYIKNGITLNTQITKYNLEKDNAPKSLLSFPGKIISDASSSRLYITDSNNNRVLILKINDGYDNVTIEEVIGSGMEGRKDGSYSDAEFFHPQGLALNNDKLYVADTENHELREVDLKNKTVKTISGLGYQSKEYFSGEANANETALNSPWDIIYLNDALYIAMAGTHQLWKLDLKKNKIKVYAGSGRENIKDGELLDASLAQPSGITTDGFKLYFADPEGSSVRSADLNQNGQVKTIVGRGLFDFGDIDGTGDKVRLQHPLGIFFNPSDNLLYIADTYNNKIKTVNPANRQVQSYSGTGSEGNTDGKVDARFNQPSGLTILNGKIYVTDTNNNLLRVIDMQTKEVKTVRITNPDKLMAGNKTRKNKFTEVIKTESKNIQNGDVRIKFDFRLPESYHINPDALPQVSISSENNLVQPFESELNVTSPDFEVPIKVNNGSGKINIEVLIYYCNVENAGLCKFRNLVFEVPVNISENGLQNIELNYTLN